LIRDGDVAAAIETARPGTGIDILMGIGGTPEGVVTAAAMSALGGVIQGQLMPQNEKEKAAVKEAGHDLSKVYLTNDLVASDDVFFSATGITDGELLRGVRHTAFGAISHSLIVRGRSKTVRIIETEHRFN
jgi:fructose-1,6-bisphosphatase II